MIALLPILQKKWSVQILNNQSGGDLQAFLDLSEDFFLLCEGAPGSAESLLIACPPSKNQKEDKLVLGIYEQKKMIGLIDIIRDYPEDQIWTIGYFLIHPEKRNQGIGYRFLGDLENIVKNCGVCKLRCVVQQQNPRALDFWQKSGFVTVKKTNQLGILEKIFDL